MNGYRPPRVDDLGTLGELTQSLLPSLQGVTPLAALSSPLAGAADSSGPTGPTADTYDTLSGDVLAASEPESAGAGGDGSDDIAPDGGADTAPAQLLAGDEGGLPFTGFAAGAIGAVGAALSGAGVAMRRASRRR